MDNLCDSCGRKITVVAPACELSIASHRIELHFELCQVCQAGLLVALNEMLMEHPARIAA